MTHLTTASHSKNHAVPRLWRVATLLAAFVLRFLVSDRLIYGATAIADLTSPPTPNEDTDMENSTARTIDREIDLTGDEPVELAESENRSSTGYLPYRYRIHDLLTIGSIVPLHELDYFRDQAQGGPYDIEIRVGNVGPGVRRRSRITQMHGVSAVRYEEHLGRLAANFLVKMDDDRIRVVVTPLLAKSPHVLYTNVVEALLRFATVHRGSMLLHSACVEIDGHGVMLSARTDTGKTGTILKLVRDQNARFLSDDMTILSAGGVARCYPKPLTISQHTLRAVDPGDMAWREWQVLKFKSRIHSKEGRGFGLRLAQMNLPIVSVNALTQIMVPPPKYPVDRLVPADIIDRTTVEALFIIERGTPGLAPLEHDLVLDELIENTDDAYGFPPFSEFAPTIVLGGDGYNELRLRESAILREATKEMAFWRLTSDSFGWAEEIPQLLKDEQVSRALQGTFTLDLRENTPLTGNQIRRGSVQEWAAASLPSPE